MNAMHVRQGRRHRDGLALPWRAHLCRAAVLALHVQLLQHELIQVVLKLVRVVVTCAATARVSRKPQWRLRA